MLSLSHRWNEFGLGGVSVHLPVRVRDVDGSWSPVQAVVGNDIRML